MQQAFKTELQFKVQRSLIFYREDKLHQVMNYAVPVTISVPIDFYHSASIYLFEPALKHTVKE